MQKIKRVAILQDEVEAMALGAELEAIGIPHNVVSYFDSAYDGLFQVNKGWGHVEAPEEFADQILEILQQLRPRPGDGG